MTDTNSNIWTYSTRSLGIHCRTAGATLQALPSERTPLMTVLECDGCLYASAAPHGIAHILQLPPALLRAQHEDSSQSPQICRYHYLYCCQDPCAVAELLLLWMAIAAVELDVTGRQALFAVRRKAMTAASVHAVMRYCLTAGSQGCPCRGQKPSSDTTCGTLLTLLLDLRMLPWRVIHSSLRAISPEHCCRCAT